MVRQGPSTARAGCGGERFSTSPSSAHHELLLEWPWAAAPSTSQNFFRAECPRCRAPAPSRMKRAAPPRPLRVSARCRPDFRSTTGSRGAPDHHRVGARRRSTDCPGGEVTSLEAITGTSTSETSSVVSEWSAVPVYICLAERGEVSAMRRRRRPRADGQDRRASRSRPRGASSRDGSGSRSRPPPRSGTRGQSSSSDAPAPVFVTFLTGQPKSTMSAPEA